MRLPRRVRPLLRPAVPALALLAVVATTSAGALAAVSTPDPSAPALASSDGPTPRAIVPQLRGPQARARLDDADLTTVARLNGRTPEALARLLEDPTTVVTRPGLVAFRDELAQRTEPASISQRLVVPAADTFTLHSRPGSQRTIYLDFDGVTLSDGSNGYGAAWIGSGMAAGAYGGWSLDSDYSTFSTTERGVVQAVWQRVSEDYAPFDVDVTTQEPSAAAIDRAGSSDAVYGAVAAITDSAQAHGSSATCQGQSGCTGISYVGTYGRTSGHQATQPAWAFTRYYDDTISIAETVSHEIGHQFGLSHDGVTGGTSYYGGANGWAPIMGSGAQPIITWSKGEYAGANNTEDDLDIIGRNAPVMADDAGGTVATAATTLPTLAAPGLISTRSDVDVYALGTCTGPVSVHASPDAESPDLDVRLRLLDADGTAVATADPAMVRQSWSVATGLDATATLADGAGRSLFVEVDGVGYATPSTVVYSDYASLGRYSLTASGCAPGGVVDPTPTDPPTTDPTPTDPNPTNPTPASPPGVPQGLTTTSVGTGSARLAWSAPVTDGGSPVTGYVVAVPGRPLQQLAADARTATLTGLSAGTTYAVSVAAVNAAGTGTTAALSVRTSAARVPGTPARPTLARGASGGLLSLTARWTAPSDGGSPITGYLVRATRLSLSGRLLETRWYRVGAVSGATMRLADGLWAVRVRAVNAVGTGPESARSLLARPR